MRPKFILKATDTYGDIIKFDIDALMARHFNLNTPAGLNKIKEHFTGYTLVEDPNLTNYKEKK